MHQSQRPAGSLSVHIGLVLDQIRLQARLTPEALARKTDFDLTYVTDILSGNAFPSRLFTLRYARASGVDPQLLLKVWEDEQARRRAR
ncbi:helix-turn-helix domain-containing protein [Streptomyces sp. NPDC102274]|uniref:helix-turn-helix domain-containing protein n=1 Tax=Streptomyces sp. NPDC102274 TaxID=3366151 RepID=UPI00381EB4DA